MSVRSPEVAVVSTLATKRAEAEFLGGILSAEGFSITHIDTSLRAADRSAGEKKPAAMKAAVIRARSELLQLSYGGRLQAIAGLGGGTGTQLASEVMSGPEWTVPKALVTTMAADPRPAAAVSGIVLVPSVTDLTGLNQVTRGTLRKAAAVVSALVRAEESAGREAGGPLIGISTLGVTGSGAEAAAAEIRACGFEAVSFHANGFGGGAMAEWARSDRLAGVIDFTIHEAVSLFLDPHTAVSRERFTATGRVPRVVLPGGVNFFTFERSRTPPVDDTGRLSYTHSPAFRHVGLTEQEMALAGRLVGYELAKRSARTAVILPMAGFSSEDRPGGAIENSAGREAFAGAVRRACGKSVEILRIPNHINDKETAGRAAGKLLEFLQAGKGKAVP